ncbi:hypothetical protein [Paenibacillus sp. KN14-4R]|uniref:hypothetical protein n=1 Tax=Paenibacillus sp. KN14-4R TaxID=3445773 RepID=UPI003FA10F56
MHPKQFIMVGTMAFAITIGFTFWKEDNQVHAASIQLVKVDTQTTDKQEELTSVSPYTDLNNNESFKMTLGASSDEDIYDALYDGKTLADIAAGNNQDVQSIINLQVAEMTAQLDERLASGSITPTVYHAQKSELSSIITDSVYGHK